MHSGSFSSLAAGLRGAGALGSAGPAAGLSLRPFFGFKTRDGGDPHPRFESAKRPGRVGAIFSPPNYTVLKIIQVLA
ncbi:hypothetical protein, partial [Helicobacter ailurogastricus]|uniref:hypothetical protein n=1 Tax=Helicobacter ailurogastricus TaxID=1578720 RepID=UPI0006B69AB9